jgi:hypothetical protein
MEFETKRKRPFGQKIPSGNRLVAADVSRRHLDPSQ